MRSVYILQLCKHRLIIINNNTKIEHEKTRRANKREAEMEDKEFWNKLSFVYSYRHKKFSPAVTFYFPVFLSLFSPIICVFYEQGLRNRLKN